MRQIALALAWEYGRRLGLGVASAMAIVFLPYLALNVAIKVPQSAFESYRFHLPYLAVMFCLVGSLTVPMHDDLRVRLYTKPISNRSLLFWLLVVPMLVCVGAHLLATALIAILYDAHWPIVRPALYFATSIALAMLGYWLILLRQFGKLTIVGVGIVALISVGYFAYFPNDYKLPLVLYSPFFLAEVLCIGITLASCLVAGYACVALLRTGGELPLPSVEYSDAGPDWTFGSDFSSLGSALRQTHRRAMNHAVLVSVGGMIVGTVAQIVGATQGELSVEGLLVFTTLFAAVSGFVLGAIVGRGIRQPGPLNHQGVSTFLATKPVDDRELWQNLASVLIRGGLYCWLAVCVLGIMVPLGIANLFLAPNQGPQAMIHSADTLIAQLGGLPLAFIVWMSFILLVIFSISTAVAAVTFLCRDRLVGRVVIGILIGILIFPLVSVLFHASLRFPAQTYQWITFFTWSILAVSFMAATFWVFRGALRRGVLRPYELVMAFGIWVILCVGGWLIFHPSPAYLVLDGMLLSCAVIGIAAAPLGLSYGRHR